MTIAVLALQGAFLEHRKILTKLGADSFEIRRKKDLEKPFDGLILPGGESTVIGKLLRELELFEPLREKILFGLPVFGTCAGMILLAGAIENSNVTHFATMQIAVMRNAYGRQLGSFQTAGTFAGKTIPMTFIRAPYIEKTGQEIEILSTVDGKIVAARQKKQLVTAFHPELTDDATVHRYFLNMIF